MVQRLGGLTMHLTFGTVGSSLSRPALRALLRRWFVTGELPSALDEAMGRLLVEAACEQRVAGLLDEAIREQGVPWPPAAQGVLRRVEQQSFVSGLRQLETASRVQELLDVHGIRCLALKGAAVAERLYGSVALRPMGDVDLLVDDWPRAVALLEERGFISKERADHARAFLEPDSGVTVELHRGVTSCAALFPLDIDSLWRRSVSGPGLVKRLPSSEDLLVHLSLHAAFQHGLALCLVQYLDFRRLLEREPPDPALLAEVAVGARAEGAVALALEAAHAMVGTPLGPALRAIVTAWLPKGLRGYVASRLREDPSALLAPAEPPLARLRWELATGRRMSLIRETLSPSISSFSRPTGLAAVGRAFGLARRWGLPTFRSPGARLLR
jgi:hypothetical protein